MSGWKYSTSGSALTVSVLVTSLKASGKEREEPSLNIVLQGKHSDTSLGVKLGVGWGQKKNRRSPSLSLVLQRKHRSPTGTVRGAMQPGVDQGPGAGDRGGSER